MSTAVVWQRIAVPFEYPVYFTHEVFLPENPALVEALCRREPGRRHRALLVVDDGVAASWPALLAQAEAYFARHADRLALAGPPLVLEGGEGCKNDPALVPGLIERFDALGLDRQSYLLVVGGGALLDAVGHAAALFHRGLRLVRVPSTVLAQADSGVGVKNGINLLGKKNLVGSFAPPFAVLNDARLLASLTPRDRRAGLSEAVKVALIRDAGFFAWIESRAAALRATADAPGSGHGSGGEALLEELVRRSAELHLAHIGSSGDPFETGSARPLDFGHWAAHKLEALTSHRLRHGEAVAIGLALDAVYSELLGCCTPADAARVCGVLEALGLPTWDEALELRQVQGPEDVSGRRRRQVLDGLAEFREHLGGELSITLLGGIGRGVETSEMDEACVERALERLAASARTAAGAARRKEDAA